MSYLYAPQDDLDFEVENTIYGGLYSYNSNTYVSAISNNIGTSGFTVSTTPLNNQQGARVILGDITNRMNSIANSAANGRK